jgi:hypothetical protein
MRHHVSLFLNMLPILVRAIHQATYQVSKFSVLWGALKLFRQTGLFENAVGGVARPDFFIYGKAELREGG